METDEPKNEDLAAPLPSDREAAEAILKKYVDLYYVRPSLPEKLGLIKRIMPKNRGPVFIDPIVQADPGGMNYLRDAIIAALAAVRRDVIYAIPDKALSEWHKEIMEAYCREGDEDVPAVYDILRAILNAGYGRGYNDAQKAAAARVEALKDVAWEADNIRPALRVFVVEMEKQLAAHDDRPGWKGETYGYLLLRLLQELGELVNITAAGTVEDVVHEAADVANMAFMIADNALAALLPAGETELITCPICNGSGRNYSDDLPPGGAPCDFCHGEKTVTKKKARDAELI